ncbi:MAG: TonB-dependent receptor [Halioglobus sp.]
MITDYKKSLFPRKVHQRGLALAVVGVLQSGSLQAQNVLEEIIVTAQKREQSVQDVPLAVTAVSGQILESLGITQMTDLEQLSPSLTISSGSKNTNGGMQIRGVGTNGVFGIQVEPSVLVVFDDVSQAQGGQAFTNLIDIERVEVLRGPQNTLFGKNASAGVLNITTRAPADEFEGVVELTATDDEEIAVAGSVSGPLSDTLGYRLTGYYSDRDGFIENTHTGDDVQSQEQASVRGKLRWQPSEQWDITLSAHYSDSEAECCALVIQSYAEDSAYIFPDAISVLYSEMVPNIAQDEENDQVALDDVLLQETTTEGASLRLNYAFNDFTLSSITAYNKWNNVAASDVDFSARDVDTDLLGVFSVRAWDNSDRTSDFFSQELRLLSPTYDNFDYLVGLYYSEVENKQRFHRVADFAPVNSDSLQSTETDSLGLFGQATWRFGDDTSLTFGARYNEEDISADVSNYIDETRITASDDDSVVLGKISLQHYLDEERMLYGSISTGYKGGAFDTAGFDENKASNPVQPEESINYEIGLKSTWLDNRLQFNAAVFFTEYDDFQAQNFTILDDGSIATQLLNVGELETKGVELEGLALLGDNFRLMYGIAYVDAKVVEWDNGPCYPLQTPEEGCVSVELAPGVVQDVQPSLAGNVLQNAPEWKLNLGGDYSMQFDTLPFDGFLNFNYVWRDEANYDIKGSPLAVQDSFGVANLNIGIAESSAEKYRVTLFVNNVFDEFHSSAITDALGGGLFTNTIVARIPVRSERRYGGVRLRYSF